MSILERYGDFLVCVGERITRRTLKEMGESDFAIETTIGRLTDYCELSQEDRRDKGILQEKLRNNSSGDF